MSAKKSFLVEIWIGPDKQRTCYARETFHAHSVEEIRSYSAVDVKVNGKIKKGFSVPILVIARQVEPAPVDGQKELGI